MFITLQRQIRIILTVKRLFTFWIIFKSVSWYSFLFFNDAALCSKNTYTINSAIPSYSTQFNSKTAKSFNAKRKPKKYAMPKRFIYHKHSHKSKYYCSRSEFIVQNCFGYRVPKVTQLYINGLFVVQNISVERPHYPSFSSQNGCMLATGVGQNKV